MATIREIERSRGTVYYIIYAHYTEGKRKQIWYRCADKEKANEVLPIINKYEKDNLIFVENKYSDYSINTEITVKELLDKYVNHCTKSGKWQAQTLTENRGRINNYIIPIIGDVYLSHISPRSLQSYFDDLRFRQAVKGNHKNEPGNISTRTIEDIKKIIFFSIHRILLSYSILNFNIYK